MTIIDIIIVIAIIFTTTLAINIVETLKNI